MALLFKTATALGTSPCKYYIIYSYILVTAYLPLRFKLLEDRNFCVLCLFLITYYVLGPILSTGIYQFKKKKNPCSFIA